MQGGLAPVPAAEAQAGGALRLGDLTQQKWSGLGNTLAGGIDAYVTEQREAPRREHDLWQMEQDKIAAERAARDFKQIEKAAQDFARQKK